MIAWLKGKWLWLRGAWRSRTMWASALVTSLGVFEEATGSVAAKWGSSALVHVLVVVGVAIGVLRAVTTEAVSDKVPGTRADSAPPK